MPLSCEELQTGSAATCRSIACLSAVVPHSCVRSTGHMKVHHPIKPFSVGGHEPARHACRL
eukprot:497100-Pelagomonas_calceolata.AAC.1